jgi:hypothetical protein
MFDKEHDDIHGECRAEILSLRAQLATARDAALEEAAQKISSRRTLETGSYYAQVLREMKVNKP